MQIRALWVCFLIINITDVIISTIRVSVSLLNHIQVTKQVDLLSSIIIAVSGFVMGFVGGMVGLVLGVVRFPVVMSIETSASITAGTNFGVSTLGAITAALRHYSLGNILFLILVLLT